MEPEISIQDLHDAEQDHEAANGHLKALDGAVEVQLECGRSAVFIDDVVLVLLLVDLYSQERSAEVWDDLSDDDESYRAAEDGANVRECSDLQLGLIDHSLGEAVPNILADDSFLDGMANRQEENTGDYECELVQGHAVFLELVEMRWMLRIALGLALLALITSSLRLPFIVYLSNPSGQDASDECTELPSDQERLRKLALVVDGAGDELTCGVEDQRYHNHEHDRPVDIGRDNDHPEGAHEESQDRKVQQVVECQDARPVRLLLLVDEDGAVVLAQRSELINEKKLQVVLVDAIFLVLDKFSLLLVKCFLLLLEELVVVSGAQRSLWLGLICFTRYANLQFHLLSVLANSASSFMKRLMPLIHCLHQMSLIHFQ